MMTNFDLSFETHLDLAMCMVNMAEIGKSVYTVVFYEDAKRLVKELACIEGTTFNCVELYSPSWNRYTKEYYVSIDDDLEIDVEPAWHEKNEWHDEGYLHADLGIALVHSDANSKILDAIEGCTCIEFTIDADADCDEDFDDECDGCPFCCAESSEDDDEDEDDIEYVGIDKDIIIFVRDVLDALLED